MILDRQAKLLINVKSNAIPLILFLIIKGPPKYVRSGISVETSSFNLHETIALIKKALEAVVCHMLFDFAIHGMIMAAILALISVYLSSKEHSYSQSVQRVAKRIVIFCLLFAIPGTISLVVNHRLPNAGVFSFNSIGLLGFWSLISVHLVFEEINNSIIKRKEVISNNKT